MGAPKFLRSQYFAKNPWVKKSREEMGHDLFDRRYRYVYNFISKLYPGQFFCVADLCKRDPSLHDFILGLVDIFYNMDFYENLEYDEATDQVTRLQPTCQVMKLPYHAPDVFSEIVKDPERWGVKKEDIITK